MHLCLQSPTYLYVVFGFSPSIYALFFAAPTCTIPTQQTLTHGEHSFNVEVSGWVVDGGGGGTLASHTFCRLPPPLSRLLFKGLTWSFNQSYM